MTETYYIDSEGNKVLVVTPMDKFDEIIAMLKELMEKLDDKDIRGEAPKDSQSNSI